MPHSANPDSGLVGHGFAQPFSTKEPLSLLLYSHFFPPSIGGVETLVLLLARGLAELRNSKGAPEFEITLVTQTAAGNYNDLELPFHMIRQPGLFQLWRLIRRSDVVHVAGPALAPLFLSMFERRPVVVEHHGYQAICPNGVLLHQPDGTVCPGHFQGGHYGECLRCIGRETTWHFGLARLLVTFPRHWLSRRAAANVGVTQHALARHSLPHSTFIYHGIDDLVAPPTNDLSAPPSANDVGKICFAYVGRLVPEKGIPVFLEAARLLKEEGHDFEIRLIGDGPEHANLEAIIARDHLNGYVHITGYLTGKALVESLAEVRVVVAPSVWEETAGLVAIEQMMRGRLVIASAIGGLGEIVGNAGLTFPPGNAEALAECMRKVFQDRSVIGTLGQEARDRALRFFRRERMIEDHARLYKRLFQDAER